MRTTKKMVKCVKTGSTFFPLARLLLTGQTNHFSMIIIPNHTFLVRFGGISGEFGRAMVRILARLRLAKIPMVRLNGPDMLPKRTKKVRLGIYRTQIRPKTRRYFSVTVIS